MPTYTGAELIIALLEYHGTTTIAGIPGGANLPLYDALSKSHKITHILARHEQGAGFIAQGIARATGKPGVCFATSGPGATNIITAIADAYLDSVPLICITGQVASSLIGTDAFQEVDTYGMSIPLTKHNFLIHDASEIVSIMEKAFAIATQGRPGPVLIDVPKDVQQQPITVEELFTPLFSPYPSAPVLEDEMFMQAAELINRANKPILYLGGGIISGEAAPLALQLAEKSTIPTTMTLMGLGAIPSEHPLSLGMLGMHAARATNIALEECDLLIAAGVRFDDRATGKISEFCPQARIIHMDIDPSEIDKLRQTSIALTGDVATSLERLLPHISEQKRPNWNRRIKELTSIHPVTTPELLELHRPQGIITTVAKLVGDTALVTTDVGKHQMWTAQTYPINHPRQFLTSGGLGTMGFGLPTAIGAALAQPEKTVVCFTGDGSLQMNIQELATAVELQVNLKIILLNNTTLGLVRQQQGLFYKGNIFASEFKINIDFATIAKGFGMESIDFTTTPLTQENLAEVLQKKGPCLLNIPIARNEDVYPMVPPGAANRTMIGGDYSNLKN